MVGEESKGDKQNCLTVYVELKGAEMNCQVAVKNCRDVVRTTDQQPLRQLPWPCSLSES